MFSIAGNAIGLAAKTAVDANATKVFHRALATPMDRTAVKRLERAVRGCEDLLFLCDNTGEIVLDRPLLDQIGQQKVTVAVRGAPVINDARLDDAGRSGITERFHVISNGSDMPSTWLSLPALLGSA